MSKVLKPNDAIKAVYEDKFQLFLQNIGVYENVVAGTEKCKFCSQPITLDNIASVFRKAVLSSLFVTPLNVFIR